MTIGEVVRWNSWDPQINPSRAKMTQFKLSLFWTLFRIEVKRKPAPLNTCSVRRLAPFWPILSVLEGNACSSVALVDGKTASWSSVVILPCAFCGSALWFASRTVSSAGGLFEVRLGISFAWSRYSPYLADPCGDWFGRPTWHNRLGIGSHKCLALSLASKIRLCDGNPSDGRIEKSRSVSTLAVWPLMTLWDDIGERWKGSSWSVSRGRSK